MDKLDVDKELHISSENKYVKNALLFGYVRFYVLHTISILHDIRFQSLSILVFHYETNDTPPEPIPLFPDMPAGNLYHPRYHMGFELK